MVEAGSCSVKGGGGGFAEVEKGGEGLEIGWEGVRFGEKKKGVWGFDFVGETVPTIAGFLELRARE